MSDILGLEDDLEDGPVYRDLGDAGEYLSASRILKYQSCPEAFRRTYVEGKRTRPNARMAQGKAVHNFVEIALETKMLENRSPSITEVLDHSETVFETAFEDVEDFEEVGKDQWKVGAKKLYELWHKVLSPSIVPLAVEERIELPIAGVKVVGYIDLVDGANNSKSVIDLKIAGRGKTDRDAQNSIQLGIYSYAKKIMRVGFDSLVKPKSPSGSPAVKTARADLTSGDHSWVEEIVSSTADAIVAGVYPKTSLDNWLCSPKWCGHWNECRGKHLSIPVKGLEE